MANGSCLCGKVTFTVGGEQTDMSHCHCSMCRKLHGSLFATFFNVSEFSFNSGEDYVQTYVSSNEFNRSFCSQCGSSLPATLDGGKHYYVPAGLLDDDPGVRPTSHIFTESKSPAYTINDDLPQHTYYGDGDQSRVVDVSEVAERPDVTTGGCLCGDVSFEYVESPKFMMNCHCTRCRKVKGAAHATNAFVPISQFRWTNGETSVVNYALPEAERFGNAFCKRCGGSVPRASSATGMFNVPVGSLDSEPGVTAKGHIYIGSKAPWFEPVDELPKWDEMPG